jgi:anti-sigma regulatory factor (Ser/Thr protein kinase)
MGKREDHNDEVRGYILENVRAHPKDISKLVAQQFHVSREAALKHVRALIQQRALAVSGSTRDRSYELLPTVDETWHFSLGEGLEEDKVWRTHVAPLLEGVRKNVIDICQYGLTEMLNNAVEHSEGQAVSVDVEIWPDLIELTVYDDGVGIFNKIQRAYGLDDPLHAILELSKGKLSTDSGRHTGEGVFFTSRMFDFFSILSDRIRFGHKAPDFDAMLEDAEPMRGTAVFMEISPKADRTAAGVFDRFSVEPGGFGFDRTIVPVSLARYGNENLISRSQARRLLARLDRFKEVRLDFRKVDMIGQAFADEVFRVFPSQHPDVHLIPIEANEQILKMIARTQANAEQEQPAPPKGTDGGR